MKQLNLFTNDSEELQTTQKHAYWKLFVDGASRNNPGPSGAGIYILKNDFLVEKRGFFLGAKTNNQAEYLALLLGLFYVKKRMTTQDYLLIISDSQLLVRQLKGVYRVKNAGIQPMYAMVKKLLHGMIYDIEHVLREDNTNADAMANEGIDKKRSVPKEFLDLLACHELSL